MELPLQVHNLREVARHLSVSTEGADYDHYAKYCLKDNFIITLESYESGFEWVIRLSEVLEDSFGVKHTIQISSMGVHSLWKDSGRPLADHIAGLLMRCKFLEFIS